MSNDITAFSRTTRRSVLRALGLAGVWTLRDFRLEDHPISRVGTHLMWDAGGAVGDDDYSALDLAASFLALTPR